MEIQKVSLKNYSSLRVGGEAKMVVVKSEDELVEAVSYAKSEGLRVHILGSGTNTFFGNNLEHLLVIKVELKGIELQPTTYNLQAAAGCIWDDIVKFSVENNLWGLENLSLIPGTVGAAPIQNIGAYGVEFKDVFVSLRALDIETMQFVNFNKEECLFDYRNSIFKKEIGRYVIVSVTLKLLKENNAVLTYKPLDSLMEKKDIKPSDVRDLVIETRKQKLPDYRLYPNAGSFFKNVIVNSFQSEALREKYKDMPMIETGENYKIPTAWLIENVAKMKGVKIGKVGTWPSQPLVVVNYGADNATEIISFEEEIRKRIFTETGISLEREVNFVDNL